MTTLDIVGVEIIEDETARVEGWLAAQYGGDPRARVPYLDDQHVWNPNTNSFVSLEDLRHLGVSPDPTGYSRPLPTAAAGNQPAPWLPPAMPPGTAPVQGSCPDGAVQVGAACMCPVGAVLVTDADGSQRCAPIEEFGYWGVDQNGIGHGPCPIVGATFLDPTGAKSRTRALFDPTTGKCRVVHYEVSVGAGVPGPDALTVAQPGSTAADGSAAGAAAGELDTAPPQGAPGTDDPGIVEDHTVRDVLLLTGLFGAAALGLYLARRSSRSAKRKKAA